MNKTIFLLLVFTCNIAFSNSVFDAKYMSVFTNSSELTKELSNKRFENVKIETLVISLEEFSRELSFDVQSKYHQKLGQLEVAGILSCYQESTCDVFLQSVTGSYHSGWFQNYKYHLIQNDLTSQVIEQNIYGE